MDLINCVMHFILNFHDKKELGLLGEEAIRRVLKFSSDVEMVGKVKKRNFFGECIRVRYSVLC